MDSGWLVQDQAVLAYMKKLEAHKYAANLQLKPCYIHLL